MVTQDELNSILKLFNSDDYNNHVLGYTIAKSLNISNLELIKLIINKSKGWVLEHNYLTKWNQWEYYKLIFGFELKFRIWTHTDEIDVYFYGDVEYVDEDDFYYNINLRFEEILEMEDLL